MTCHYITSLRRACGRPAGRADAALCDFHVVLDAFEGQWALDTLDVPAGGGDTVVKVMSALARRIS